MLFKCLLEDLLAEGYYISTNALFFTICVSAGMRTTLFCHLGPKKGEEFKITIFPKYVGHLVGHYKAWRVNQKKRVAITVAASSIVVRALHHNTGVRVSREFEAQVMPVKPQQPVMQSASNESESTARALQAPPPTIHLAPLPWGVPPPPFHHTASQSKKRARKVCSNCNDSDCNAPYTGKPCTGGTGK
jgi:hypothetical protein